MRTAKVVFSFTAGSILLTGMLLSSSTTPARCDSKTAALSPRLIASSKLPTPQAGLKLLQSIFTRMGNEPQLAKNEKKQQAKEIIAFQGQNLTQNQLFLQNQTDPALMIRPQEKNKAIAGKTMPMPIQGMNIAMAPPPADSFASSNEGQDKTPSRSEASNGIWESDGSSTHGSLKKAATPASSASNLRGFYAPGPTLGRATTLASAPSPASAPAKDSERGLSMESQRRLSKAFGNLAGITQKMQEAQQMPSKIAVAPRQQQYQGGSFGFGSSAGAGGAPQAEESKESKGVRFYKAPRGTQIIDDSPTIKDYRTIDTNAGNTAANRVVAHAPKFGAPMSPVVADQYSSQGDEGTVKLDQPSAFKYNREYGQNSLSSADNDELSSWGATTKAKERSDKTKPSASTADSKASFKREAESRSRQRDLVAYVPPSMVAGIPGLMLGSSEYETSRFLANRGDILKETIDGWKVWSLRATGTQEPLLQVYIRNNQVQGLRIFERGLTPPGLGVSLGDGLVAMKQKFGEPAFILQEPINHGGKNYVYPVSQVSFQVAKPSSGEAAPKVVSLLLFKFI